MYLVRLKLYMYHSPRPPPLDLSSTLRDPYYNATLLCTTQPTNKRVHYNKFVRYMSPVNMLINDIFNPISEHQKT